MARIIEFHTDSTWNEAKSQMAKSTCFWAMRLSAARRGTAGRAGGFQDIAMAHFGAI